MGRLRDKLTGTRYPDSGVVPVSSVELRASLFALNGPDVPFRVRNALPEEKGDVVAEWRVMDRAWRDFFLQRGVKRTLKTQMLLVPKKHEVHTIDEEWEVTWAGETARLVTSRAYARGQLTSVTKEWTYERGEDGRRHKVETFSLDTRDMKNPLRKAVLGGGWTWRGKLYKL